MDDRIDRQDTAVTRIIDGSITIDSLKEFENLLKIFPDNPGIHRVFADFLAQKKSLDAVDNYRISADLFIQAGQTLQAIVSKIFEWRLARPSRQDKQDFYSDLHKVGSKELPVQRFFAGLAVEPLIAFMNELTPRYVPAQSMVKKFGDRETHISFVVSGALEQTTLHPLKKGEKVRGKKKMDLVENDFFGEGHPFEEEIRSSTEIKTITRVELAEISKSKLMEIFRQHADVEPMVNDLYQARLKSDEKKTKIVRKTVRHQLPTQVCIKIFHEHKDRTPIELSGFTDDISLGGASVVLGAKYHIGHALNLVGKNIKIRMCLPIESIVINMLGTIVWARDVHLEGTTTAIVGVQFKEMSQIDSELLKEYCYGSEGEQNLIWSLWGSFLEK
jgi:CRP-like cAMP-binding protein